MSPSTYSRVGGDGGGLAVYLINCSVCKGEFSGRQKWMEHLTLDCHQNLAREDLQKDVNNLRECSLMVFTTCDLTRDEAVKIIQYFGSNLAVWVTDYVWWEERPRFAVVQFESRKKVKHVLGEVESISGDLIQIGNQRIQVKGAFDLKELEWKALLPGGNSAPEPTQKSKDNELRLSPSNDNHQQLSNSINEERAEGATEFNSREGDKKEDNSMNEIRLLFDLAKERQWEPPVFKLEKMITSNNKKPSIIYTVLLNGQVYRRHRSKVRVTRCSAAKKIAAKFCLKALKKIDQTQPKNIFVGNDDQKKDDTSATGCPIATLKELSKKLYGIFPEFKIVKVSNNRKYYCRIVLNGMMYTPPISTNGHTAKEAKKRASQSCLKKLEKDDGISAQKCLSAPSSHSSAQFTVISEFVEIPNEKWKQVVEIVRNLGSALRKRVPSIQVKVFRNWYLKLRNSPPVQNDEQLFLYIYAESGIPGISAPPSEDNFTWIPSKLVQYYLKQCNELFQCLEDKFPDLNDPKESRLGCKFLHKPSGIPFTIVNFKRTMAEVQCCRLVKYFCEFDPRIRPLLILARYWQMTNGIHWGEPEVSGRISHQCLPDPHPLDWMILTFLMGEKLLPSLRSILERPHKAIFESATNTDIGFCADMDFVRNWKNKKDFRRESTDHFNLAILQIFQNFLEFCCTKIFYKEGVIINPKDGEVLGTRKFLNGRFVSKLSSEETEVLKKLQENSDNKEKRKYCVNFKVWKWYMIHPLITSWRFSVPGRKYEMGMLTATRKTNERLKNLLRMVESEGAEKAFESCGASLCEILKVDKEIPGIDPTPSRKRRMESPQVNVADEQTEDLQEKGGFQILLKINPKEEAEGPSSNKKIKFEEEPVAGLPLITFDLETTPGKKDEK